MRSVLLVAVLLIVACRRPYVATPPSTLTGSTCGTDRVATQETAWREVSGDGFTFCVPANWSAVDAQGRRWQAQDLEFAWAERPPHPANDRPVTGAPRTRGARISDAAFAPDVPNLAEVVFSERIDGRVVRLTMEHPAGRFQQRPDEMLTPRLTL